MWVGTSVSNLQMRRPRHVEGNIVPKSTRLEESVVDGAALRACGPHCCESGKETEHLVFSFLLLWAKLDGVVQLFEDNWDSRFY